MRAWYQFVKICANYYQVNPTFALAVARVESGLPGGPRLRFGKLGKGTYYGPFGIHKSFMKRWPIDNPYVNAWVGIRALHGVGSDPVKQKARMRRYNTAFNEDYWRAVKGAERRIREEGKLP